MLVTLIFTLIFAFFGPIESRANFSGSPIVLIPGDGGTQIWAKLNKSTVPHYVCYKKTSYYYTLWLNLEGLAPYSIDCFVDNMKLIYNNVTRKTSNTEGVYTEIRDFGNTTSIEWLDPSKISSGKYFAGIVEAALKWGYTRGKDIRGAPFDFRKAPNELGDYFAKLKKLIEETYYVNRNKKVFIIAHSLGNNVFLCFLQRQSQAWKDKFIRQFISVAAPWGGSTKIMLVLASGYNLDQYSIVIRPLKIRKEQRSMPSSAFLLPSPQLWKKDELLVVTKQRNYTVQDYKQFYTDIKFKEGYQMYLDTKDLVNYIEPPGVDTMCIYGIGSETANIWTYGKGYFPNYQPTPIYGDGDGTVNERSSSICKGWATKQKQPINLKSFQKKEHLKMLYDAEVLKFLESLIMKKRHTRVRRRIHNFE